MEWTESSAKEYMDNNGISYRTYMALGPGSTYEEQYANARPVLDTPYTPGACLRRFGQIGDTCPSYFNGRSCGPATLVARLGTDVILRQGNGWDLVTVEGTAIESQVGGTLEDFLRYREAWASMANNLAPQNPFSDRF
jgi:hypothetical protein